MIYVRVVYGVIKLQTNALMVPAKLIIVIIALSVARANAIAVQKDSFHLMIQPARNAKFQTVPNVLAH